MKNVDPELFKSIISLRDNINEDFPEKEIESVKCELSLNYLIRYLRRIRSISWGKMYLKSELNDKEKDRLLNPIDEKSEEELQEMVNWLNSYFVAGLEHIANMELEFSKYKEKFTKYFNECSALMEKFK